MSGMADEFDTTEEAFDAMFAEGEPVAVRGPSEPVFVAPGSLSYAPAVNDSWSDDPRTSTRTAATAAAL